MAHSRLNRITIGDIVIGAIMVLLCAAALYPVWYTIIISFNDSSDAMRGGIYWFPRKFSLESYKTVFQDKTIVRAFMITVLRTVIGTVTSVFFTAMVGYAFSKKYIMGNKVYTIIGTITMFFGGGLIPYFITLKNLGLYDNFLVYIIPDMLIFIKIILPLSMPVLATIALFNGVGHWNDYFAGVMYINKAELQPIQTYLYRVVASASASKAVVAMPAGVSAQQVSSQSVRLATMVVTTFPIMCVYPFLQKYFVKGMLIGSIKG